jgi:general transcription factor IIIA
MNYCFERVIYKCSLSQRLIYVATTCASCNAPLDNSEQLLGIENPEVYCSQTRNLNHLPVSCASCSKRFTGLKALKAHANCFHHSSFCCGIEGCAMMLVPYGVGWHFKYKHHDIKYHCAECGASFDNQAILDRHGEETMHAAYVCRFPECGSESTRIGDLHRHQLKHKRIVLRHSCPHCRK